MSFRDGVDRVGSTIIQSLAGSLAAGSVLGVSHDWRAALAAAGGAGLLALAKWAGVQVAALPPAKTAAELESQAVAVAQAIGKRLSETAK